MTSLEVEVLPHGEGLPLPRYETDGAAGLDLRAAIANPIVLAPMERRPVPTGLRVAIPRGFEGQVRARSGLALKHGIALVNAPGTIDSDYRGEVQVLLVNLGPEPFAIEHGMRIAQLLICPVERVEVVAVSALDATKRGAGGFGSTGV
jgi:dUTP pyrophosphatase